MENEAITTISCIDCSKLFELGEAQKKWFEDKGMSLPKRCVECRKAKKSRNNDGFYVHGNPYKTFYLADLITI